jgi:hypothetical protein
LNAQTSLASSLIPLSGEGQGTSLLRYLYDKIVPRRPPSEKDQSGGRSRIKDGTCFSFVNELVKDCYTPNFGRPAEDPES